MLVALTTMSARPMSLAIPTDAAAASVAASSARSRVRLRTVMSVEPARPSASTTERAAPPAPITATRASATSIPTSASEATNPAPSVLDPTSSSPSQLTVLTDCSARAAGSSRSTESAMSRLCGIVTDSPAMPSTRIASSAAAA